MSSLPTPYNQQTLRQFLSGISATMGDPGQVYWKEEELTFYTWEALMYFGACTNFWRVRGTFPTRKYTQSFKPGLVAFQNDYLLPTLFPTLRTRSITADQLIREMQYMLLENPSGLSGSSMSGQVSVGVLLDALRDGVNRLTIDTRIPLRSVTISPAFNQQAGVYNLPPTTVYAHSLAWQESTGRLYPLYRQDAWAADKGLPGWTISPDVPQMYSESQIAPLGIQLIPPPIREGRFFIVFAEAREFPQSVSQPADTYQMPDEWIAAAKYAALATVLSSQSQIADPLRAAYCDRRYQQYVSFMLKASSVTRLTLGGVPLPLTSLYDLNSGDKDWMNKIGPPQQAGCAYDMVFISPGKSDAVYSIGVDMVRSAPLPSLDQPMPVGLEDIPKIQNYVQHLCGFKCGGKDFTSTMSSYDDFMRGVSLHQGANAAKIQYLEPLFGQPAREWAQKPDVIITPESQ